MTTSINKILIDYIEGKTNTDEFEAWLYAHEEVLENELGKETYLELVSVNYKHKLAKYNVTKLLESMVDYGALHRVEMITLIDKILAKACGTMEALSSLWEWAMYGYGFFYEMQVIGNYNEQGKSIILAMDDTMTEEEKWNKVSLYEPGFFTMLVSYRDKLINGQIVLAKEKTNNYYPHDYTYVDE